MKKESADLTLDTRTTIGPAVGGIGDEKWGRGRGKERTRGW